jgi:NADH dehydrogenase FAD-containing subunit
MSTAKTVVILGLGYVGMRVFTELDGNKKFKLIAIDAKDYFENVPGAIDSLLHPSDHSHYVIEYNANPTLRHVYRQGFVVGITKDKHVVLQSGERIAFDYAVIGTGSSYHKVLKTALSTRLELNRLNNRLNSLKLSHDDIQAASAIAILGGGAVSVELAAGIAETFPHKNITLVTSSSRILNKFSEKASDYAVKVLESRNVRVVISDDFHRDAADLVIPCTGGVPNTSDIEFEWSREDCIDERGYIRVTDTLQIVGMADVFAAGDVTNTLEEKTANYADYGGLAVATNIQLLAAGKPLKRFPIDFFNGAEALPFVSGVKLGKRDGIMQMAKQLQTGSSVALMHAFLKRLIINSVQGKWFWRWLYKSIKRVFARQISGL